MLTNAPLNFADYAELVSTMTTDRILGALADIHATLPHADSLDRETGTDRGGYYRDQCSVLRREIRAREAR